MCTHDPNLGRHKLQARAANLREIGEYPWDMKNRLAVGERRDAGHGKWLELEHTSSCAAQLTKLVVVPRLYKAREHLKF